MATHERELTEPVDLCTPDGARLNPDARGWSRQPLHRANLEGEHGRNKRWDYWAILAGDLVVSAVYSNVDYVGLADVYWADIATGDRGGWGTIVRDAEGFDLPELPGTRPLTIDHGGLELAITDDADGTTLLYARWTERDGAPGALDIAVDLPPGHESLNVVIPWSDREFNFTSKHQARPARGELNVGDRSWRVDDAWGVLDVGRGRWPADITWNWGGAAGRDSTQQHVVGLQVGGKWTAGSGFTENGLIVDGRLSKLGHELTWEYDWDAPLEPWRVVDPGGQLHATLTPRFDKHTKAAGRKRGSETHQVFGTWTGSLTTDDGVRLEFTDLQGFAEEARQHW